MLLRHPWALGLLLLAGLGLSASAAGHTPLPTGNGYCLASVTADTGAVSHFYPHPYRYERADPKDPLGEGIESVDLVKSVAFAAPAAPVEVGYRQESHVVSVRGEGGETVVFSPFGLEAPALALVRESADAAPLVVETARPVASRKVVEIGGVPAAQLMLAGGRGVLLVVPLEPAQAELDRPDGHFAGSSGWVLLGADTEADVPAVARAFGRWRGTQTPLALVALELADLEAWRVKPTVHFRSEDERRLWRQSEVVLRMGQVREGNRPDRWNHGLIVASLGEWFVPWVRDMAYATVALNRMGHRDEARRAVEAYFNARPVGRMSAALQDFPYQVSVVRYFGDGAEEPFFTMEGATNIELDNWGLVLWALGDVACGSDPAWLTAPREHRGSLYASARDYIVTPLFGNLDPCGEGKIVAADTSIWEEHQPDAKHFAFSAAAAIVGLREFATLAERTGDASARDRVQSELALLQTGFDRAYASTGRLRGTLEPGEKNDVDGAALAAINLGVPVSRAVLERTVAAMDVLRVASGGWRRVRCQYTDPKIFEYWYEREEFVFTDLDMAQTSWRLGRRTEGDAILDRLTAKAALDHHLIPEMYVAVDCELFHGAIGDPTGAGPMVGYGAGAYILALIERERLAAAHD
jgi:hypothetical protein